MSHLGKGGGGIVSAQAPVFLTRPDSQDRPTSWDPFAIVWGTRPYSPCRLSLPPVAEITCGINPAC